MKKIPSFLPICALSLILVNPVYAQRSNDRAPELLKEATGKVEQVEQQQNTQNQAEDQKLRVENVSQEGMIDSSEGSELLKEEMLLKTEPKRLTAGEATKIVKEKNNDVANQVQSLLTEKFQEGKGIKGGIGEQVRTIAQEQLQAQEKIKNSLSQLEERPAWKRFFFGQEKSVVLAVDETLEEQSQKINEWRELLEDPSLTVEERLAIEETVLELQAQQELVEAHVTNVLEEFNVAGFFRRLFRRS